LKIVKADVIEFINLQHPIIFHLNSKFILTP